VGVGVGDHGAFCKEECGDQVGEVFGHASMMPPIVKD
jgi:hypothetical protein